MLKPYLITIKKTARPMGNNREWQIYDDQELWFSSIEEVKEYLKDQYYYCKTKYKTYHDNVEGQTGFIYAFKSDPMSYDDCKHYEQHWINIYNLKSKPVII